VAEPGRQQRQAAGDVAAVADAADERGHSEGVPEVDQPGGAFPGRRLQSGFVPQDREGVAGMVVQPPAGAGDEQRRAGAGDQRVPFADVRVQRRGRSGVQRERPGDVVLGLADPQPAAVQADVLVIEVACLAGPQAGDAQQGRERLPGQCPQAGPQPAGGGDQGGGLFRRVAVPARPAVSAERQDVPRRDLVGGIEGVHVAGEQPHGLQPPAPVFRPGAPRRVRRPPGRGPGRDQFLPGGVHRAGEAHHEPALRDELVAQAAPHLQVLPGGLPHGAHDAAPLPSGHGRARGRSAAVLTLR